MTHFLIKKADLKLAALGFYFIIVFLPAFSFASTMTTYDSEGAPIDFQAHIKASPEIFVQNMELFLKQGNLDAMGVLSSEFMQTKNNDPKAIALHIIFLASKGNITHAADLLEKIPNIDTNSYALYAKAMILSAGKDYKAALRICDQSIVMDTGHPFPFNIKGRIYFDIGEYQNAIENFQTALKLEPNFLPSQTNLGAVFFTTENYQNAVKYFKSATIINPGSDNARYGLALSYERMGQYSLSIKELKKTLDLNPKHLPARQELAALYLKKKQYQNALEIGETMQDAGMPGAHEILGSASLYMGNPKEAETYFKEAPVKTIAVDYLMGFCLMMLDRHAEALIQMENILNEQPDHYGAYYAHAALKFYLNKTLSLNKDLRTGWGDQLDKAIYFSRGCVNASSEDWGAAESDFHSSEGMVQGFSIDGIDRKTLAGGLNKKEMLYLNLGLLYYFKNQYNAALDEFKKALKANKHSILSNYWSAQTSLSLGERKKALVFFENSINLAPNFFASLYAIGELSLMSGDTKKAVKFYEKAITVKKDPGILVKLGILNEKSQNYEKAEKYYDELIKYHSNLFIGYNQLAWLYARQGIKLDKALTLALKADRLQPGNASILDTMGWIYFQKKDNKKALETLKHANKVGPANPSILYHLGAVYAALQESDTAKTYLNEALNISKNFDEFTETQALFNKLK